MKKLLLVFALFVGFGCQPPPVTVNNHPPATETAPAPVQPPIIIIPPVQPVAPSVSFIHGYRDGYFGSWLAPARWMVTTDYRNGWSAGSYDRKNGLPNKYPH